MEGASAFATPTFDAIPAIKGPIERLMSDDVSSQVPKDDYLRVILTDEEEIIDPMGKLRSVYPHIMALDVERCARSSYRMLRSDYAEKREKTCASITKNRQLLC